MGMLDMGLYCLCSAFLPPPDFNASPMSSTAVVSRRSPLYKLLGVLFILAIVAFITVPNYVTGNWAWERIPEISTVRQMQKLQQQGLTLPGWKTLQQQAGEIGGHRWSVQAITPLEDTPTPSDNSIWLMLRPQIWHRDTPQVDWMDINGIQGWTVDSLRSLEFQVAAADGKPVSVSARFFKGRSPASTHAVVQWYAWATGGSSAPSQWFWADQFSQWQGHRTAWVAVSLLLPIQPLDDLEAIRSQAEALGQQVQIALMNTVLTHP